MNELGNKALDGKFSFSQMCSQARLCKIGISLPEKNGVPDWEKMEEIAESLYAKIEEFII